MQSQFLSSSSSSGLKPQVLSSSSGLASQVLCSSSSGMNLLKSGKQPSQAAKKILDKTILQKKRSTFVNQGWLKRVSGSLIVRDAEKKYEDCQGVVSSNSISELRNSANYAIEMFANVFFKTCGQEYVRNSEIKKVYDSIFPPIVRYASSSFKSFAPEFDSHFQKGNLERGRSCLGGLRFVTHLEWTAVHKIKLTSREGIWREFVRNNFREIGSKSTSAADDAILYESLSIPVKYEEIIIDGGMIALFYLIPILTNISRKRFFIDLAFGNNIVRSQEAFSACEGIASYFYNLQYIIFPCRSGSATHWVMTVRILDRASGADQALVLTLTLVDNFVGCMS